MPMSELADGYAESTIAFMKKRTSGIDVTNVSLAETVRDFPIHFWGFLPLYPVTNGAMSYALFSTDDGRDVITLPNKILTLTVPERVKRLNIQSLPRRRSTMEALCIAQGLPSIVIALGEQKDPIQEVAFLLAVNGYSIEEALSKAQDVARISISKRN